MRTFNKLLCLLITTFSFAFSFAQSEIQIVRIDFQNPEGYTRHLALGFVEDNSATDGVDYGYDAPYIDDLQDDLNWMIDDSRYIIQGVGAFDSSKYYPLGLFLSQTGDISISLNALEDFPNPVDVYLYDLELDSYTLLNTTDFTQNVPSGTYVDRYFLAFSSNAHLNISTDYLLSTKEEDQIAISLWHSKTNNELKIIGLDPTENSKISLYSIEGKKIREEDIKDKTYKLSTTDITNGIYLATIETPTFLYSTKVCIAN